MISPATPISKEPLCPAYGQNEWRFADVVNWTVHSMIIADEKGITSSNVDAKAADPPDDEAARLLGGEGELQTGMGLAPDAFFQVIKQVGNFHQPELSEVEAVAEIDAATRVGCRSVAARYGDQQSGHSEHGT